MNPDIESAVTVWKIPGRLWVVLLVVAGFGIAIFYDSLAAMVNHWDSSKEYGYGYFIPVISCFLVWQQKDKLERIRFNGSWTGLFFLVIGLVLFFLGKISTIYVVMQYGFLVVVFGVALGLMGWFGIRRVWVAVLFLIFMIPLPGFFYSSLNLHLQLLSSQLGVAITRVFGVPVYLSGNVIDLGVYKLQVAEACSGLRYLFPLTALSFIAAFFYKSSLWKRGVIFLSSIPITVFMNSFRIGVIGVLVDYYGISQAEGFLHYFEGWVVFMVCVGILVVEMWLLLRVGRPTVRSLSQAFAIDWPQASPSGAQRRWRRIPGVMWASLALLVVVFAVSYAMGSRRDVVEPRTSFTEFPLVIGPWRGQPDLLQRVYLNTLQLSDYLLADYTAPGVGTVNFYIAYYQSQRAGASIHSPSSCIPGGGWVIRQFSERTVPGVLLNGKPLRVNRVLIKKGGIEQVVYYWFQGRGRDVTNQYALKWYLFLDAFTRNRTDGALVRLTAMVAPGNTVKSADHMLTKFAQAAVPLLGRYIPN